MTNILDAKIVRDKLLNEYKEKIKNIEKKLKLVVIRVGDNPSSIIYVNSKRKVCEDIGILFEEIYFNENTKENELIEKLEILNKDANVTSILVQLPLPNHINPSNVINKIDYKKDVDGLTFINIGKLLSGEDAIEACTAKGIISLLEFYNISLESKNITIINRSTLIGKPLIPLLLNRNATVTVCHSKTKNLSHHTKNADIIIVAVGKKDFLTKDMVSENVVVIDVGINKVDGKIYGDAHKDLIGYVDSISPVPGGVGLMTVCSVAQNVYNCYKLQSK
ncbi:MAG: bifunctional 5,10-methylenetetrahydrofolate dehydrogenase/5,10-methenyltetrahydrofolate cyclohydrolase [Bacilli bacterium]|nr:bifunctional 5,10-methylenetetrahydrofolate dehydrogenase/5,10-methenyltetrahydrofolate cyclohydrolase [Bacilli bacterium]